MCQDRLTNERITTITLSFVIVSDSLSEIAHTNKPHRHPAGVGISGGTGDSQYHPVLRKLINEKPQASDVGFGYLLSQSFISLSPQIYGLKLPMPSKSRNTLTTPASELPII